MKVMLAASEIPKPEALKFPLMASFKMDGVRCAIINGVAMSRKMLPYENQYVQEWAKNYAQLLDGLDGELLVGPPHSTGKGDDVFNRSSGPVGKRDGQPDFSFWVFEKLMLTLDAQKRYEHLTRVLDTTPIPRVKLVQQMLVQSIAQLNDLYATATSLGYEGLILKKPSGMYKHGRSTLNEQVLMKWKAFETSEAVVLAYKQGTTNTNALMKDELGHAKRSTAKAGKVLVDTIGSWQVRDIYSGVEFNCPPGSQTEPELKALWASRDQDLGRLMRYKFQPVGSIDKPRFPGFVSWTSVQDLSPDKPAKYLEYGKDKQA